MSLRELLASLNDPAPRPRVIREAVRALKRYAYTVGHQRSLTAPPGPDLSDAPLPKASHLPDLADRLYQAAAGLQPPFYLHKTRTFVAAELEWLHQSGPIADSLPPVSGVPVFLNTSPSAERWVECTHEADSEWNNLLLALARADLDNELPWSWEDWAPLSPQLKHLLRYMHRRDNVPLDDLRREVWGGDCEDPAIHTAVSRANDFLVRASKRSPWKRTLTKPRGEDVLRWE
jgi:hypothetical protein